MSRARDRGARRRGGLLVLAIVIAGAGAGAACTPQTDPASVEHRLERRLLAPCCWRQTLEDHESPTATTLRSEIRRRIAAAEDPGAIEDDLVARYGEQIRALPAGKDPKWIIGVAGGVVFSVGLVALIWTLRRRRQRRPRAAALGAWTSEDSVYADRLDDELAETD